MSRFVSSGTNDEPSTERDEAWLEAQRKIDATKQSTTKVGEQEGGKSLYETLQANKAAKQEAFEEATRLRNQFQSLNEDEVEFLDSVLESTRHKEAEVKKETREQLEAFRRQQEEAAKLAPQEEEALETPRWEVGSRKRKKGREKDGLPGVKIRRMSTAEAKDVDAAKAVAGDASKVGTAAAVQQAKSPEGVGSPTGPTASPPAKAASSPVLGLGLAAYSSDEDD